MGVGGWGVGALTDTPNTLWLKTDFVSQVHMTEQSMSLLVLYLVLIYTISMSSCGKCHDDSANSDDISFIFIPHNLELTHAILWIFHLT